MDIKHHPQLESLMSCSAGSMPEAFAAVMASHIEMCPECCKELALMERIGVSLFKDMSPAAITRDAPVMAARRAESEDEPHSPPAMPGDMPKAIANHTARYLDDIPWKGLTPRIMLHVIKLSKSAQGDLRLLKVAPGAALAEHGHEGSELTLVLRGAFTDKTGTYRVGDVADLSDDIEHKPVADPVEGCICLIASDRKIRFKSVLARLAQPLTGM